MPHRLRRIAPLFAIAVALVVTLNASAAKSPNNCDSQINDTAARLLPCVTQSDLTGYMNDFWKIALAHPSPADGHPSRNSGEPGYKASADYVAALMQQWGYDVRLQRYTFPYFAYKSTPTLSESSPTAKKFILNEDFTTGQSLGSTTSAKVQPAGGIVIPPTNTPSSSSGCTSADFVGFTAGHIALIQRGSCNFGVKVLNAESAGASAVIIFNEGNPTPTGRIGLLGGSIEDANDQVFVPRIPVAFTTFAIGETLYNDYRANTAAVMSFTINALYNANADDWNVVADSKGGDPNHVLVIDAHLDAIYGAGMLDNASGSATILDLARMMRNVTPVNKLRFIWFGGEELGLLGSHYYVTTLSSNELNHIGYDLDADVTSTPNYTLGILDPAGPDFFGGTSSTQFPNRVYKASVIARDSGADYLTSQGYNHEYFSPVGTDAFEFNLAGIPASGVLTGQDCCKTQREVDLFGGTVGNFEGNLGTFDGGCVDNAFVWCDNLVNNDFGIMTLVSRTFASMALRMAFDTKVMSASGSVVYNKNLAIAGEAGRHFKAQ